ncbi:hypothetical protein ACVWXM_007576 [Bradyrhizobium sp. GM7.3]
MFHKTGPGKVDVDLDFSGVGVLHARLWNFDFDDFAGYQFRGLKTEHFEFLKNKVVSPGGARRWSDLDDGIREPDRYG